MTAGIVVAAVQGNHVALNVFAEIVILPIGRRCSIADAKAHRAVALIVEIPQGILLGSVGPEAILRNRQSLDYIVFGIAAVEVGFPRPDAAGVVLIIVGFPSEPQVVYACGSGIFYWLSLSECMIPCIGYLLTSSVK